MIQKFSLVFQIPKDTDLKTAIDRLYENGCSDALIGLGRPDHIALTFDREDESLEKAIISATKAVKKSICEAVWTDCKPNPFVDNDLSEIS